MMEAIQIMVSNEIENRMEDINSTAARHVCEPCFSRSPWVETDMGYCGVFNVAKADYPEITRPLKG